MARRMSRISLLLTALTALIAMGCSDDSGPVATVGRERLADHRDGHAAPRSCDKPGKKDKKGKCETVPQVVSLVGVVYENAPSGARSPSPLAQVQVTCDDLPVGGDDADEQGRYVIPAVPVGASCQLFATNVGEDNQLYSGSAFVPEITPDDPNIQDIDIYPQLGLRVGG
ncbi:MAG: hypothetical protein H0V09_09240 [Gemmatimonadetes bacterium]|nr:hypothetical protein [Gemmatimonadota bacterium]